MNYEGVKVEVDSADFDHIIEFDEPDGFRRSGWVDGEVRVYFYKFQSIQYDLGRLTGSRASMDVIVDNTILLVSESSVIPGRIASASRGWSSARIEPDWKSVVHRNDVVFTKSGEEYILLDGRWKKVE